MEPMPIDVNVPDGDEEVPQYEDWYPGMGEEDRGLYFTIV